ncbi:pyruvate dehydrogenase E1 subunit alpha [Marinitoga sp. 1197]|uniref:pyruvate dehydrogenase (acetyl-transferring) E1 component subunit alpha n=1 Tax=unclassified Marinitoga TaxID=2640159 RepID=UPI000640D208|nr:MULTISPECIES: pyruvate dehydrogenase (acetyl-transferring) E1 component subunit alpha [unclassified Marinitoga]KLO21460.1 pyruvate dehydrogenase E1 subunit alpha [Marinitoga sp. 1197]KLO24384.1 pyruvate dehydrogenase E1 subunit alpha [Marinitoga sp. 1155]NUU99720.1 dehydrogenase [Marinitoga sp. 1154]
MKDLKNYDTKLLKDLLFKMLLIRRFEEKAAQAYGLKKIGGFLHLYIGEEAVAVGSISNLDMTKDYVAAAYRDHGHALATGLDPNSLMAELYGKITGCSKGKGGSMHFFDYKKHFFGGNGIVGAQIPVATGIGLKIKYNKEDGVVLCYFGDGAIHQGAFHESLNLAKIWNLPVVYICENNHYGMGTDYRRVSAIDDFSIMADSYAMNGKQVNGMNVLEVYEATKEAIEIAKNGTPVLLEAKTYRFKGHSMSDPAKYRTKEELEKYKQKDPIISFKELLKENNIISEEDFLEMDKQCKKIAKDAAKFAEESPEPDLDELYTDIYA